LKELTLGRSRPSPVEARDLPGTIAEAVVTDADLPEIEARCRLKSAAARRAASHLRQSPGETHDRSGMAPEDPEVAAWAERMAESFYWANSSQASRPADISWLDDLGGCFEAVAEAIALVREGGIGHRGRLERALPRLAEAQSALRGATQRLHAPDDPDQLQVFEWLKATAARHRVYLKRFMRADDPAEPARWPEILDAIEALRAQGRSPGQGSRPVLDRLRPHLERIREGRGGEPDWQAVVEGVDEMVGTGSPPSDREIRELLLPVIDDLPDRDDLPDGFRLVLREIDRFLATRTPPSGAAPAPAAPRAPTAEVQVARRLLGGRGLVLIGGLCRREAQEALRAALGLKELIWIETREHQSIAAFEPAIARPDVALVLLAIRWSSHAFGDVKRFCDRHRKPLVRLPGGYGPNQVAAQILAQCSEQLAGG
jgi:hypothetical protein